jgi:hypothetical protein
LIGESGTLYLAILDLHSRFTVSWAVSAVNERHLTLKALGMAVKPRGKAALVVRTSSEVNWAPARR